MHRASEKPSAVSNGRTWNGYSSGTKGGKGSRDLSQSCARPGLEFLKLSVGIRWEINAAQSYAELFLLQSPDLRFVSLILSCPGFVFWIFHLFSLSSITHFLTSILSIFPHKLPFPFSIFVSRYSPSHFLQTLPLFSHSFHYFSIYSFPPPGLSKKLNHPLTYVKPPQNTLTLNIGNQKTSLAPRRNGKKIQFLTPTITDVLPMSKPFPDSPPAAVPTIALVR